MLTSATATPSAAMPQPIEGPVSSGAPASGAADFLALLGGVKAAKKTKPAAALGAKPTAMPHATAKAETPSTGVKAEAAIGEAAKATLAKPVAKTATEAKATGEAAKAQQTVEISAAILAALGETAKTKATTETPDPAAALATAAPVAEEPAKAKTKAPRTSNRREGGETVKSDATAKSETPAPNAKPKAEGEAAAAAPQPRMTDTGTPAVVTAAAQFSTDPLPQAVALETQVTEARIPLASREAAQTGIAAPILAMRVITKDGVAKSIEIRLDPAELGQVDVKLETGHDGKLKAVLSAENAEAFELLKKDSGALESALREAGVDLEDGAITFALNDSGADQSHQREAAYGGAGARRDAATHELAAAAAAETTSWRNGVIDISV